MMELWPFTNFHDLNLDWIVRKIRNVEDSEAAAKASEEAAKASEDAAAASATSAANSATSAANSSTAATTTANEIQALRNQIDTNTAEIDNLVAHAGDESGNSELLDIRVAYDGRTYTTAGAAVRAQAVRSEIPLIYKSGYINGNLEHANPSSMQQVYTAKIPVEPGDLIQATFNFGDASGTWCVWAFCDKYGRPIERSTERFPQGQYHTTGPTVPAGVYYIQFSWYTSQNRSGVVNLYGSPFRTAMTDRRISGLNFDTFDNEWTTGSPVTEDLQAGDRVMRFGWRPCSPFIKCNTGLININVADSYTAALFAYVAEFDATQRFIGYHNWFNVASNPNVALSAGTEYVRVWFDGTNLPNNSTSPSTETVSQAVTFTPGSSDLGNMWQFNQNVHSINHMGYNPTAPENTLPAFRLSKQKGFDRVECDVCMTSDRVPVILHDQTINRTARNADGTTISETINIADITYQEALQYDFGIWRGSRYAGTRIPTLEQFLKLCRDIGLHPYVELKWQGAFGTAGIDQVLDIANRTGMRGKMTWVSFEAYYLELIADRDPEARLGYIAETPTSSDVDICVNLRTGNNEVFLSAAYPEDVITDCQDNNVPIEIWTKDTTAEIINMDQYITGVTSDNLIAAKVLFDNNI